MPASREPDGARDQAREVDDENRRLDVLRGLRASESPPRVAFEALLQVARHLAECPVAMVNLVEAHQVRPVASIGLPLSPLPRDMAFCSLVLARPGFFEVPDAQADARFAAWPVVAGATGLRYYGAMPVTLDGAVVGTLCVLDHQPRRLDEVRQARLGDLARVVEELLRQHRQTCEQSDQARRLHDLARASGDWMWELGSDLRCRWISGDFQQITGTDPIDVLGQPLPDEPLVGPDGEDLVPAQLLMDVLARRQPFARVVTRRQTPRGPLLLSRSGVPVLDAEGGFAGFRGTARDVTARFEATRQRRQREDLLQRLSRQVPGALVQFSVSADGREQRYLYASEGLAQWVGTPVVGSESRWPAGPDEHIDPVDLPRWRAAVGEAMASQRPLRLEYRLGNSPDRMCWVETRASVRLQPDGSAIFHGFTSDITERRQFEHSRLENEVLRREKAAAEATSRAKTEFLSRASHELRTPLNAVVGFAQLMAMDRQHPLGPEQAHRLEGIRRSGQHLLEMINDVLDLARIEQGAHRLRRDAVDLASVVATGLSTVRPLAATRGIQLEADLPVGSTVLGDPLALEQVLINLLSNAIKYNSVNGTVTIRSRREGEWVVLRVADQGPGLDASALEQLFQPFNRLGAERHRIEGSGLGLVIVRDLVHAMNGEVTVSSEPGRGSEFSVRLPVAKVAPAAAPPAASAPAQDLPQAEAAAPGGVPTRPPAVRQILYVEDEPLNVVLMQEIFRSQPAWVLHVARDGTEGVALARQVRPDLALIDMNLPDFNGLEVLRQIRADESLSGVTCVALSADAMSEQISAAKAAGFDDYWTKPIDLMGLLGAVGRLLDDPPRP